MLECKELNIIRSNTPLYDKLHYQDWRLVDKEVIVGLIDVNGRFCKLLSYPCKTGNHDHPNFRSSLSELCFVDTLDKVATIDKLDTVIVHDVSDPMNVPIESVKYLCTTSHGTATKYIFIVNDTCILSAVFRNGCMLVGELQAGYFSYRPKDIESVMIWDGFYVVKTPDGRYDALQNVNGSIDEYYTKSKPHKKVIKKENRFQYPKDFTE